MISHMVRKLRTQRGWSMTRVDREAGLATGHCRKIERGERLDVTLETAQRLANAFGVPVDELRDESP